MTTLPADQRLAALASANRIRSQRAAMRAHLKVIGREQAALEAAFLIERPPDWIARLRVEELLGWLPGLTGVRHYHRHHNGGQRPNWWGWAKEFRFSTFTMVHQLTPRQRALLAERLRLWSDREEWMRYCARMRAS